MPAVVHLSCRGSENPPREETAMLCGERVPDQLGKGEWVAYYYRVRPGELYCVGPYTVAEAEAIARMFRSAEYQAYGFRGVERLSV